MKSHKTGPDDPDGKTLKRAVAVLAVGALAIAIGLVADDMRQSKTRRFLPTDANLHRAAAAAEEAPFWAPEDPALTRPDAGSDQHG